MNIELTAVELIYNFFILLTSIIEVLKICYYGIRTVLKTPFQVKETFSPLSAVKSSR